jgi:hypothetical protein
VQPTIQVTCQQEKGPAELLKDKCVVHVKAEGRAGRDILQFRSPAAGMTNPPSSVLQQQLMVAESADCSVV